MRTEMTKEGKTISSVPFLLFCSYVLWPPSHSRFNFQIICKCLIILANRVNNKMLAVVNCLGLFFSFWFLLESFPSFVQPFSPVQVSFLAGFSWLLISKRLLKICSTLIDLLEHRVTACGRLLNLNTLAVLVWSKLFHEGQEIAPSLRQFGKAAFWLPDCGYRSLLWPVEMFVMKHLNTFGIHLELSHRSSVTTLR